MVLPLYLSGPFSLAIRRIATLSWKLKKRVMRERGGAPEGGGCEDVRPAYSMAKEDKVSSLPKTSLRK